jgi:Ser/Thr protein kinase RdoA (MazF antagonist)
MSGSGNPTEQEIAAVLAQYNLGEWRHCAPIMRGHVNEKWLLETEGGQVLLKRRHVALCKPSLVQAQHALVGHLRGAGFPAPALVRTRYNNTFVAHGGAVYEVQGYVAGEPFDAAEPQHLAASGHMLGAYHNAVRGFDRQALHQPTERYGPAALSSTVRRCLEDWQPSTMPRDDVALLRPLIQELEDHARDLENRYLALGRLAELVIHGDYHGANLVFEAHHIAGVVDYDLAHWCSRAMEVAEAIIAFCTDPGLGLVHIVYPGALDLEVVDRFVTAYLAESPLTETEIRALPDMIRTIWLCASLDPPLEPLLSRNVAPQALPEILALAEWARAHGAELVERCLAAQVAPARGRDPWPD